MSKLLLLYVTATLLMLAGLLSLYYSFRKPTAKEKMIKAMMPPRPKNYGNPFLCMLGLLCIVLATLLLFKSK
jgi:uncharacterized membrane protein HdeD (DUF308 family)